MSNEQKLPRKLFVIDDEPDICDFIQDVAEDMNFDVITESNPLNFPTVYSSSFDVLIMDLSMPEMDGIELIRFLGDNKSICSLILISGFDKSILGTAERLARDRGLNVIGALSKPLDIDELEALLGSVVPLNNVDTAQSIKNTFTGSSELPSIEELKTAIENKEIVAYFQPQISSEDQSLIGVETLARWNHPIKGMIPPSIFIPMAEKNDLIDDLTECVLDQSLEYCRFWNKNGLETNISINFSAKSIENLDLPEVLSKKLKDYTISPKQIVLEITESVVISELQNSLDVLTRLRMKGFKLSIDDFGTGFSSMQQLQNIPFTELKIDQSFVMRASHDTGARIIVETTNDLGKKLGMKIVAEGVEDQETMDILKNIKCDIIQGYYIARPMPGDQILPWVKGRQDI